MTSREERNLTGVAQEKHLLFLCFDLFCRFFWIFSPFSPSAVVVDFIGTTKSNYAFEIPPSPITFFIVVINLCLYIGLL